MTDQPPADVIQPEPGDVNGDEFGDEFVPAPVNGDEFGEEFVPAPVNAGGPGSVAPGSPGPAPRRASLWRLLFGGWSFRQAPLRQKIWMLGGAFALIAVIVTAVVTFLELNNSSNVLSQVQGTTIAKDPQNSSLKVFTDNGTRISLDFPASWSTADIGGADVRLVAGPGGGDLMSLRVDTLDTGTTAAPTAASLKPYLDTIVNQPTVKIISTQQITMDNLSGWYYVYTFTDSASKKTGIHAQYFIIRGNQLYSIVFQALPESDFSTLANSYQQVANSIRFF